MALTGDQRREFVRLIDQRYRHLSVVIHEDVARARDESYRELCGGVPDNADQAVADLLADLDTAEVTRDLAQMRDLEAAKLRLADGSYGECITCGDDIGADRLRAYPTAVRCVRCQSVYEHTYAQPPRASL